MKKFVVLSALSFMFALGLAFAQSQSGGAQSGGASGGASVSGGSTTETIAELLPDYPKFETLVKALKTAGLYTALQGSGPYTIFAPTTAAFIVFPSDQLDALMSNPDQLAQVLKYSIVSGKHTATSLTSMTSPNLTTLEGGDLTVNAAMSGGASGGGSGTGTFTVNGAQVTGNVITASNGLIYPINKLLIPSDMNLNVSGGVSGGAGD